LPPDCHRRNAGLCLLRLDPREHLLDRLGRHSSCPQMLSVIFGLACPGLPLIVKMSTPAAIRFDAYVSSTRLTRRPVRMLARSQWVGPALRLVPGAVCFLFGSNPCGGQPAPNIP